MISSCQVLSCFSVHLFNFKQNLGFLPLTPLPSPSPSTQFQFQAGNLENSFVSVFMLYKYRNLNPINLFFQKCLLIYNLIQLQLLDMLCPNFLFYFGLYSLFLSLLTFSLALSNLLLINSRVLFISYICIFTSRNLDLVFFVSAIYILLIFVLCGVYLK